jgi:hypothetical protein
MSQSINLGNVNATNFNGSNVERINLNGSQIWLKDLGSQHYTTNRSQSLRNDKLSPDYDVYGFFAADPGVSIIDHNAARGAINPGYYKGVRMMACYTTPSLGNACTTGGVTIMFYGTTHVPFTTVTIEGQVFTRASAGYYHRWGPSNQTPHTHQPYAGNINSISYHWHGQGRNLFRGASSSVVFL